MISFVNNADQRLIFFVEGLTPTVGTLSLTSSTNYA